MIGIAPSEPMFNRKLRAKLPEICVEEDDGLYLDDDIRDRDLFAKSKNKRYIDSKRNASEIDLQTCDSVLVRQSYQNKLSTPFISTPYKLIEKTGNKCVVESPEGVTYQRNSTQVKKYNDPISVVTDSGTVANDYITISNNDIQVLDKPEITETTAYVEPPTIRSRPKRECRMPTKYKDFVV